MAESGSSVVRLHQSKDLSHGRYVSLFGRPAADRPVLLPLHAGKLSGYPAHLDATLSQQTHLSTLCTVAGPIGGLALLEAVADLAAEVGAQRGLDISRPRQIPACGLGLYSWAP